jgi:hypothetical protein
MDDIDDLSTVDPLKVDRGDSEVGVAELALDHVQRDALSRHFNGMGVTQLMRREATTDTGSDGQPPKLGARRGGRPSSLAVTDEWRATLWLEVTLR